MKRKAPQWVRWFPEKFLSGTQDLNDEQGWTYVRILCMLYDNDNALPLEPVKHPISGKTIGHDYSILAYRLRMRQKRCERIVHELISKRKLNLDYGCLHNDKVQEELDRSNRISAINARNSSKIQEKLPKNRNVIKGRF